MMLGISIFGKWLIGSKAGRILLLTIALSLAAAFAVRAFNNWKTGIYDEGFNAGVVKALADCEVNRKAYFDLAAAAARTIEQASTAAANKAIAASSTSSAKIDIVVSNALRQWTKTPLVVERDGKCKPVAAFGKTWNEINKEANK